MRLNLVLLYSESSALRLSIMNETDDDRVSEKSLIFMS